MSKRLHKSFKLSPHKHTGKRLPHKATSHGLLLFVLIYTGITLFAGTHAILVSAATDSGAVNLRGKMPGPPPRTAPVISEPSHNQRFNDKQITVSGTCSLSTYVQIYRNSSLAGTAECKNRRFSLKIDLVPGKNVLYGKSFDNLGQYGPDSVLITVYYDASVDESGQAPLLVTAETPIEATNANSKFPVKISINGGKAPYAVIVNWGDKTQDLVARSTGDTFTQTHTYVSGGVYQITVAATDENGKKASAESVALISGVPATVGDVISSPPGSSPNSVLSVVWPLYLLALAIISSFWFGEKFQYLRLKKAGKLRKRKLA